MSLCALRATMPVILKCMRIQNNDVKKTKNRKITKGPNRIRKVEGWEQISRPLAIFTETNPVGQMQRKFPIRFSHFEVGSHVWVFVAHSSKSAENYFSIYVFNIFIYLILIFNNILKFWNSEIRSL